jgi:putative transposase
VNDVLVVLDERLAVASPDLPRSLVKGFAAALMSAEADTVCGVGYRERCEARVNSRNGYRLRDWDTRTGSIELAIPKTALGQLLPGLVAATSETG